MYYFRVSFYWEEKKGGNVVFFSQPPILFVVSSVLPTIISRGPPKVRSHFAGYMSESGDFFAEPDGLLFYVKIESFMQA